MFLGELIAVAGRAGVSLLERSVRTTDQQPEVWVCIRAGAPGRTLEEEIMALENPPGFLQSTCGPAQGMRAVMWTASLQDTSCCVEEGWPGEAYCQARLRLQGHLVTTHLEHVAEAELQQMFQHPLHQLEIAGDTLPTASIERRWHHPHCTEEVLRRILSII